MTATVDPTTELAPAPRPPRTGWRAKLDPKHITGSYAFFPLLVLFLLNAVDELDRVAFAVLAPEIRDAFGLSIAGVTTLAVAVVPVALLLELPVAWFADRRNRTRMAAGGAFIWAGFSALTGLAGGLAMLYVARMGSATGKTLNATHNSLISDYYPVEHRTRAFYFHRMANPLGQFVGPLAAGTIAYFLGWRAPFLILAVPSVIIAVVALRLREPTRGRHEREAAGASEAALDLEDDAVSFRETWRTLLGQRSTRRIYLSMPFLSAAVLGIAVLMSLFYEEVYDVNEAGRGAIFAVAEPFGVLGIIVGAVFLQRYVVANPGRALQLVGLSAVLSSACLAVIALSPNIAVAVGGQIMLAVVVGSLTPGIFAVASLVVPPHMRTQGFALVNVFILLGLPILPVIGAIGDSLDLRVAILFLLPVLTLGGLIFGSGGKFVAADIDRVNRAARAASERRAAEAAGDGAAGPLLRISGIDVSYGQTQVLFGVDLEVEDGEILALLGTNGAGKSTVLRAVAGLTPPSCGSIIFDGRDITSLDARSTSDLGIAQVPGGRGVFPSLTVADNFRVAGWARRRDKAGLREATEQCLDWFPALRARWDTRAGDLSGGEQQMLSLSQAFLARPKLLMIDELSLGLAPTIVERLLDIVRAIHRNGTTVVLVEQSVQVALRLAERAVFLEKGDVRFEGPTSELLERTDILRAVYLKGTRAIDEEAAATNGHGDADRSRVLRAGDVEPATSGHHDDHESDVAVAQPVLRANGVSKRYGGVVAVDRVTFSLAPGELLGVIGPNGAGKTTLFDLLTGFAPLDDGAVFLGDDNVSALAAHGRARLGLGRTFQDARLWPSLTVRECLAVSCERDLEVRDPLSAVLALPVQRAAEAAVRERVDELIELVGVEAFADKFLSELSTGSRRMIEIGCLLGNGARTLLLDEPSSGIAQKETEALGPVLLDVREQLGASIVLIEHDMTLLTSVADRLLALDTGQVVTTGSADEVLSHPRVVSAYLGDATEVTT